MHGLVPKFIRLVPSLPLKLVIMNCVDHGEPRNEAKTIKLTWSSLATQAQAVGMTLVKTKFDANKSTSKIIRTSQTI